MSARAGRSPRRRPATADVRDELAHVRATRACDRRAELAGLLRSAGTLHLLSGRRYALEAANEHPGIARLLYEALRDALDARGEVLLLEPGRGHPRQRYVVRADGLSLQRLVEAGILDESGGPTAIVSRRIVAKRCCKAAYLRGVFLARGSVSTPDAPAHLEIRGDSAPAVEDIAWLAGQIGVVMRTRSHNGYSAYCKDVGGIGTLLAAMGAHDAYLAWEAATILKGVHVEASRLANADAANARRSARAAVRQIAAITELAEARGLRSLAPALREIAELRLANPDASLDDLGRLCDPPVSKGAAADRMRRLLAQAERGGPDFVPGGAGR